MRWGLRVFLAPLAILTVLSVGMLPAAAAKPLLGTVDHGWISRAQPGKAVKTATTKQPALYANFVWKRAPTARLPLEMRWIGPQGFTRAAWKSTTLKTDLAGTRLYSRVSNDVFKDAPGSWKVQLVVNNVVRGQLTFRVTS
jgi:hypothetical protein